VRQERERECDESDELTLIGAKKLYS